MTERPLVVDANVMFAALLRDGTTRRLVTRPPRTLYAPAFLHAELERHIDHIAARAGLGVNELRMVLPFLERALVWVPEDVVERHLGEAVRRVGSVDPNDVAYVAAALAVHGILWTHDRALRKAAGIPTITTAELLALGD